MPVQINGGGASYRIERVETSCSCAGASTEAEVVKPGRNFSVNLSVDPRAANSRTFSYRPEIGYSWVAAKCRLVGSFGILGLNAKGGCLLPAATSPPMLLFGQCCQGDNPVSRSSLIRPAPNWRVADVVPADARLTASTVTTGDREIELIVSLDPSRGPIDIDWGGYTSSEVRIVMESSSNQTRIMQFPVKFRVIPDVYFAPSSVVLRDGGEQPAQEAEVAVRTSTKLVRSFKLLRATVDDSDIELAISTRSHNAIRLISSTRTDGVSIKKLMVLLAFESKDGIDSIATPLKVIQVGT